MSTGAQEKEHETTVQHNRLQFEYLPGYAHFLLETRLQEFTMVLIRISREIDVPLLKYFAGMPEEALIALSLQSTGELLNFFSQNRVQAFIDKSVQAWRENQLPLVQYDEVVVEDISLVSYARRKAFREFLPGYTADPDLFIRISDEIDRFSVAMEEICYKTLFEMKQQKLNEHHYYLLRSEHQLQEAQEIAGMGSFEWDLTGGNSVFSTQLFKIFDLEERTNLLSFLDHVHPFDRQKVRDAIDKAIKEDGVYECEYRYGSGAKEKVIWSRGIVAFQDGKPQKMKGTVMDVTQRHHMLKRLERSEELHKQAQALTHIGNWSWLIQEDRISWSDEMYRIYGLAPQSEVIDFARFITLVHPDDRQKRQEAIQKATQTHEIEDYTMRIVLEDGTIKILQGKGDVLVNEDGQPYKMVGTCQDITKQALLLDQLRESEETFRQLIVNAPDAVVVIDEDSSIMLWNPKAEELFGWTSAEATGKDVGDTIVPPVYRNMHHQGMKRLHDTGISHVLNKTIEITARKKSGEEFYIALSIARSLWAGKQVFVSFIRDISKEKNAEQELEEQRNQLARKNLELERSNQELMAFNYIASHDLKEPVRKIKIFSNLITEKSGDALPENIRDYLGRISGAANHMQKLIEALFAFSRTTSADRVLEPTDLNILLQEVLYALKDNIEEEQAIITATDLPVLPVIPFQFHQLLENIICNALKYTRPGVRPEINITASLLPGNTLTQEEVDPEQTYCAIAIRDNGIGFDQQYANKIFELFQRLHSKNEFAGTGIGLAICKKIVQHHHGFITAEGEPGRGATFTIYIPAKRLF